MSEFREHHGEGPVPTAGFDQPHRPEGALPAAGFDVAGQAFETARDPDGVRGAAARAPNWVSWAVLGGLALVATAFVADGGWNRAGLPYASWYWPDEAPGMQIAHGGARWVLDPRQQPIAVPDAMMAPAGTFGSVVYYAPRGGGGGRADAVGPVYVRVGPSRYLPLVEGGPSAAQMKREMLEGGPPVR